MKKNSWNICWTALGALFCLMSCSSDVESPVEKKIPCRITVDLGTPDSRLILAENDEVITSVWGTMSNSYRKEGLRVVNLADNKAYTFMLVEGQGTSRGVFESEETPVDGGADYMVYYPYDIDNDKEFGRSGSYGYGIQNYEERLFNEWSLNKLTMRHRVGHFSDIRFTDADYQTEVIINGVKEIRSTSGANFDKTTIMKVKASGFPENIVPVAMKLKPYNTDLVTFWNHNDMFNTMNDEAQIVLENYPSLDSIDVYLPLSYRDITFPAGSWLRASFVAGNGKTYYSDKLFEKETVMTGGKLLVLNFRGEWISVYDPDYNPDDQNSAEWEEIIR